MKQVSRYKAFTAFVCLFNDAINNSDYMIFNDLRVVKSE